MRDFTLNRILGYVVYGLAIFAVGMIVGAWLGGLT